MNDQKLNISSVCSDKLATLLLGDDAEHPILIYYNNLSDWFGEMIAEPRSKSGHYSNKRNIGDYDWYTTLMGLTISISGEEKENFLKEIRKKIDDKNILLKHDDKNNKDQILILNLLIKSLKYCEVFKVGDKYTIANWGFFDKGFKTGQGKGIQDYPITQKKVELGDSDTFHENGNDNGSENIDWTGSNSDPIEGEDSENDNNDKQKKVKPGIGQGTNKNLNGNKEKDFWGEWGKWILGFLLIILLIFIFNDGCVVDNQGIVSYNNPKLLPKKNISQTPKIKKSTPKANNNIKNDVPSSSNVNNKKNTLPEKQSTPESLIKEGDINQKDAKIGEIFLDKKGNKYIKNLEGKIIKNYIIIEEVPSNEIGKD